MDKSLWYPTCQIYQPESRLKRLQSFHQGTWVLWWVTRALSAWSCPGNCRGLCRSHWRNPWSAVKRKEWMTVNTKKALRQGMPWARDDTEQRDNTEQRDAATILHNVLCFTQMFVVTHTADHCFHNTRCDTGSCTANGVRCPCQIRGPKIRANVPPKGPCWRHRVCHLGAIVVAWAARGRLGVGRI